jgi:hypothetical protein
VTNVDFRCPTPQELDAIAAFQQWLGRRFELDLAKIKFRKDIVERYTGAGVAEEGRALFLSIKASCNACHFNAGASRSLGRVALGPIMPGPTITIPGANRGSPTGVDILRIREVVLNDVTAPVVIPRDIGDRSLRTTTPQADGFAGGGFNVQSLIEAPRKKTFFHNGAFNASVEDAATFYFTPTFDATQIGVGRVVTELRGGDLGPVALAAIGGTPALNKLGLFLRALSAYYSLADCERLVEEMIQRINLGLPTDLPMIHCQFALTDVKNVLNNAKVRPRPYLTVVQALPGLEYRLVNAPGTANARQRLQNILTQLRSLRNSIATSPELP